MNNLNNTISNNNLLNDKISETDECSINFNGWWKELVFKNNNTLGVQLANTEFSCLVNDLILWDSRKKFIERVVGDIVSNCPKNEPLVLTSLGSDRLLIEALIGKFLIESGFENVSFFLVDPLYLNKEMQPLLQDFRKFMENVFHQKNKTILPSENIRFLSRAQSSEKYFPKHANVALIESLAPDENFNKLKKTILGKSEKGFCGSNVPSKSASAITFVLNAYENTINNTMVQNKGIFTVPVLKGSKGLYCLEWGCKIQNDGSFSVLLENNEEFLDSLKQIPRDEIIYFKSMEIERMLNKKGVVFRELIPTLKNLLQSSLKNKIIEMKEDKNKLTEKNREDLLLYIQHITNAYFPDFFKFYFLADYATDKQEALNIISENAGHHYRKRFSYKINSNNDTCIDIENI